jgi:hypothetical protein
MRLMILLIRGRWAALGNEVIEVRQVQELAGFPQPVRRAAGPHGLG